MFVYNSFGASIKYVDKQGGGRGSPKYHRYYINLFSKRMGVKNSQYSVILIINLWMPPKVRFSYHNSKLRIQKNIFSHLFWPFFIKICWKKLREKNSKKVISGCCVKKQFLKMTLTLKVLSFRKINKFWKSDWHFLNLLLHNNSKLKKLRFFIFTI